MEIDRKKVFLSHHSSKVELAVHLSRYLEKNGIVAWYAPRDIPTGADWPNEIENAIASCSAFILLFCAKADSSQQVKRELALADKYKKPVFWVKIENVEPNNLGYFLTATQWLNWLDNRDDTLEQLVRDIYSIEKSNSSDKDNYFHDAYYAQREKTWVKGLLAFSSDRDAAECVARVYFNMAQDHPDSSMVLPTGRSATMIFRAMCKIADEYDGCPFGESHIISDTETFGVWSEHETSRTKHIKDMLLVPLKRKHKGLSEEQLHLLSGVYTDGDPIMSAQKTIRLYPPVVHAVSLSPLGEILAYEVGTYNDIDEIIDDAPRIVEVGEHSKKYIDPNQPSKSILTIGMGTVFQAEILLIVAFDLQKASIINRLFYGPMTAGIPATLLRNHPNAYVLTTEKVANEAKVMDIASNIKNAIEGAKWITEN
ncbi:MAG: TIR domain-containing protein [Thomasclavelia spiroformis]|uniref:TIR domain-containing protein n=1 Tax=Thomasclavelia spiroformis TaxID=29348 RepID=UPI003990DD5F